MEGQVDGYGRRQFSATEDKEIAPEERSRTRYYLESREALHLDRMEGRSFDLASKETAKDRAGFYCKVCSQLYKDSIKYTQHLNSRQHNDRLGMAMQVRKVTVHEVRQKLQELRERRRQALPAPGPSKKARLC